MPMSILTLEIDANQFEAENWSRLIAFAILYEVANLFKLGSISRLSSTQKEKCSREMSPAILFQEYSCVKFGTVVYPFYEPVTIALDSKHCAASLFPLDLRITGNGDTIELAIDSIAERLHRLFQRLCSLVPGEMTQTEHAQWRSLSSIINLQKYEEQTPIQFRKIAEVVSVSPFKVRWWGDEEPTCLDLRIAPPKLAGLTEGNKFEAVVEFSRKTREITKILTFEYLKPMSSCDAPPISGLQGLTKVTLEDIWGDE